MLIQNTKRTNITVDDRRAVIAGARVFKPSSMMTRQTFIINELKARLNWTTKEKASDAILDVADQMCRHLLQVERDARAAVEANRVLELATRPADTATV